MLLSEGKYSKVLLERHAYRVMKCQVLDNVICLTDFKPGKSSVSVTCPKTADEIKEFAESCSQDVGSGSNLTFTEMKVNKIMINYTRSWARSNFLPTLKF